MALQAKAPQHLVDWLLVAADWGNARLAEVEAGIERTIASTNALLGNVDMLLTPVMHVVNFPATELGPEPRMPLRHTTFTAPFNQSGHPAVTICAGVDSRGLPVGIQLVGHRFDDLRLLRVATWLEDKLWPDGRAAMDWPLSPRAQPQTS